MTDFSSKGLLPQLTDVLHALADSQALLLSRIHDARTQPAYAAMETSEIEEIGTNVRFAIGSSESTSEVMEPTSDVLHSLQPERETSERSLAAHELAPQGSVLDAVVPHDEVARPSPESAPATPSMQQAPVVGSEPANRSFNFFDELDDRLAGLDAPRSAHSGSVDPCPNEGGRS